MVGEYFIEVNPVKNNVIFQFIRIFHSMEQANRTFKSKIGIGLSISIAVILIGTTIPMLLGDEIVWLGIGINLVVGFFIFYTFTNTVYIINGNVLHIKCGFLYNKKIDISMIKRIEESRSPLSSPAASMDRLEIIYNKFDSILISPKKKKKFIEEILKINPDVIVRYRKKKI